MKKKTNLRDRDDLSTRDIGHFPKVSLSRRFHCSEIFSTQFGGVALFGSTTEQFAKVFSVIFYQFKFLLMKVSRCTVLERFECRWN